MKRFFLFPIAVVAMAFCACHSEKHAEEHHHEMLIVTEYTDEIELFAEISPMVSGDECEMIIHLTDMNTYKPVVGAKISPVLRIGSSKTTLNTLPSDVDGIYETHFTPNQTGDVSFDFIVEIKDAKHSMTISGLHVFATDEEADEDVEDREIVNGNAVVFPKEKSWAVDFSTAIVTKELFGQVIRTVAQVMPSQDDEFAVSAVISGVVSLSSADLTIGSEVKAGQAICHIDASNGVNDNVNVISSQAAAEYERARNEYERIRALQEDRLVTVSQVNDAKAAYESAKVAYNNIKRNFASGGQNACASRNGFIKQINVKNGEFVEAGSIIAVITQTRNIQLRATVEPSKFHLLSSISGASIRKHSNNSENETLSLEELGGRVVSYGRMVETSSTMIPVTFEITNTGDFVPGTFVDMYIRTEGNEMVTTIPSESIIEEMGNYFVFVQLTPELFEKRQVHIGVTDGMKTEITRGVELGERVVVKGAVLVKLQQASGTVDPHAGHSHG